MLINKDDLKKEEINSRVHKVRAVIQDNKGKIYVTNMDNSYNLPGGRVEAKEEAKYALIRELAEELGIQVLDSEIQYIGDFTFWHRDFPGDKRVVNRENHVDLFWVMQAKEVLEERVRLTNYEKHYHFHLMKCSIKEIDELLQSASPNDYKKFTDVELSTLLEAFLKYKGEDNYVR